ncbi:Alpha/beta hydrolase family protein [Corynebacterium felinum]|nr:Alpha/beta hydrolase family protein [Corynebacterium felinum]
MLGMANYSRFFPEHLRKQLTIEPESRFFTWENSRGLTHRLRYLVSEQESDTIAVLIHGLGGHGEALWPYGSLIASQGISVAALDLPLFGHSSCTDPARVTYGDWIESIRNFVDMLNRPVVLVGFSLGGLAAVEAGAGCAQVKHVVATCVAEAGAISSLAHISTAGVMGVCAPLLLPLSRCGIGGLRIPMWLLARFSRMSSSQALSKACARDVRSGRVRVPLNFLASLLRYKHEDARTSSIPVTVTHPGADRWTPLSLSAGVMAQLRSRVFYRELENCGHFPIEEPGLSVFIRTIADACGESGH